jgi:SP family sugar:H+ symporter-like MFS transporter
MAIVLGIFISQLINYGLGEAAHGETTSNLWGIQAWRWMLIIESIPAVIYIGMALTVPESPRYLIASGQLDKARAVLTKVEGGEHVDDRIAEIRAVMSSEKKARFRDLIGSNGFVLPIVLIGIGLSVFQQFVGINVIFYYSSLLWQSVGYNVSNSLLLSVSTSIVNVIGTVVAISVIDRIGRKPLALIGSFGMSISLAVVAFAFSHVNKAAAVSSIPKNYGTLAIVGAHVYVFFFAMSWGVVVWVLLGEMFPNKIRALALSVAASFQWVANFAISQSFPTMSRWSLSGSYIIYACFAFLSIPFILKFVKETKGKKLEDFG